jgi:hypothetical protein
MLRGRIHYSRLVRDQLAKIHLQTGGGPYISEMACHVRPTDLRGPRHAYLHHGQSECSEAGYITADWFETNSQKSTCRPGAGHTFGKDRLLRPRWHQHQLSTNIPLGPLNSGRSLSHVSSRRPESLGPPAPDTPAAAGARAAQPRCAAPGRQRSGPGGSRSPHDAGRAVRHAPEWCNP